MPDLSASQTALRAPGHVVRVYMSVFKGTEVMAATVDTTPTYSTFNLTITVTSGSASNVKAGFRVDVFTSGGLLKGRTRVRYAGTISSTNLPIRELSKGTINVVAGDIVKVYREVREAEKLVTATRQFKPDNETYSDQNENPRPLAGSGGPWAGDTSLLPISINGGLSEAIDPDSGGSLTYLTTLPSGLSFASGTSTSQSPTVTGSAGSYLIQRDVTDSSNSKTTTQWVPVVIHDDNNLPYDVQIENFSGDEDNGWSATVRVFENASLSNIPDGSLCILWRKETINGATQSFGAASAGRSHIVMVGYAVRDTSEGDAQQDRITFEIQSPLARLGQLLGLSKVMIRDQSPNKWREIKTLTVKRAAIQIVQAYCNLNEAGFDLDYSSQLSSAPYPALYLNKSSPLGQLRELADSRDGRMVCDRTGRFLIHTRLELLALSDRTGRTTTLTLGDDDIIRYTLTREHERPLELYRARGITKGTSGNKPAFAKWVGKAPGTGIATIVEEKLIVDSATDLFERAGRRGAFHDRVYQMTSNGAMHHAPRLDIELFGSYDVFDFYNEWIQFASGTTDNLREIELSTFRWILRSVSVTYEGGTARTRLMLDAETNGEAGVDDTPPSAGQTSIGGGGTWTPPDDYVPPPTIAIPTNVTGIAQGTGRLALICNDGTIRRTWNWTASSPYWDTATLSGATISGTILRWRYDARSTENAVAGWIVTSTGIYYVSDVFGATITVTLQHTFTTASTFRSIDASFGAGGVGLLVAVSSYYTPTGGVKVTVSLDGGVTWGSEVTVTSVVETGGTNAAPGITVSSRVAGLMYTTAMTLATGDGGAPNTYVSRDYGATWAIYIELNDEDLGGNLHIPWQDNDSGIVVYWGVSDYNGGDNTRYLAWTTNGTTITRANSLNAGPHYNRDFSITSSPNNRLRMAFALTNRANTIHYIYTSTDGFASVRTQRLVSTNYKGVALVNDNDLYLWGASAAIGFSADHGANIVSKIGNLSGGTFEVVGITG